MKTIKRTAIIGMGALGLLYGAHILKAEGPAALDYILDDDRYARYQDYTVSVNGEVLEMPLKRSSEATPYDLVMVAVKYGGLQSALDTMKHCVGPDTIIMSVMNGIDSEELIDARYHTPNLIGTVAQGMDAMREGASLKYTQMGVLCIGALPQKSVEAVDAVEAFFQRISMPYSREENIRYRMWAKWMLNVGINQTCMVYQTDYSHATAEGTAACKTLINAMNEVQVLSWLEGVNLKKEELDYYLWLVSRLDPAGYPSMEQDRRAGRKTEVDMFAGTVIRLAEKHHLEVPENRWILEQVRMLENDL